MNLNEERKELDVWFYRVIESHVIGALSCAINTKELKEVAQSFNWPKNIKNTAKAGNSFIFAFRAIINKLAQHQLEMKLHEPVNFIFDKRSEQKILLNAWEWYLDGLPPETKNLTGDRPIFRDSKEAIPLQAADMYAHWVFDWEKERKFEGVMELDYPWEVNRDILRLHGRFRKEDFKHELDKALLLYVSSNLDINWTFLDS